MTNPPISRRSSLKVPAAGTAAMPFIGVANTAPHLLDSVLLA